MRGKGKSSKKTKEASRKAKETSSVVEFIKSNEWIDLAIVEAYKKAPKNFRKVCNFNAFYMYYRDCVERALGLDFENMGRLMKKRPKDASKFEEGLCRHCGENIVDPRDMDFCKRCITQMQDLAEARRRRIIEVLKHDEHFQRIKTEAKAVAYLKRKYGHEGKENKFLDLKDLAKEQYKYYKSAKK